MTIYSADTEKIIRENLDEMDQFHENHKISQLIQSEKIIWADQ